MISFHVSFCVLPFERDFLKLLTWVIICLSRASSKRTHEWCKHLLLPVSPFIVQLSQHKSNYALTEGHVLLFFSWYTILCYIQTIHSDAPFLKSALLSTPRLLTGSWSLHLLVLPGQCHWNGSKQSSFYSPS